MSFFKLIKQSACFHTQPLPEDKTCQKEQCRQALPGPLASDCQVICYLPAGEEDVLSK